MRQNGCSCAPSTKHTKCGSQVSYRMPLASKGSHQISSIRILNFPLWLIISLDTKPQEPEAGCQYSAFSSLFTPLRLHFKISLLPQRSDTWRCARTAGDLACKQYFSLLLIYLIWHWLKVHYATFLRAVNKKTKRVLDARNSRLQELTWLLAVL